jgi:Fur family iron response transcriptional regulator
MKSTVKQMVTSTEPDVAGMLKAHGILPTQQRVLIARALFARCGHYSADQVLRQVNTGDSHVSKATVYNTLGLFARTGLVREVIVDPTRVFYDPNTQHHHHFYNMDTGELIDIEQEQLDVSDLPEPPAGTVADGVEVIIRIRNESAVN